MQALPFDSIKPGFMSKDTLLVLCERWATSPYSLTLTAEARPDEGS